MMMMSYDDDSFKLRMISLKIIMMRMIYLKIIMMRMLSLKIIMMSDIYDDKYDDSEIGISIDIEDDHD